MSLYFDNEKLFDAEGHLTDEGQMCIRDRYIYSAEKKGYSGTAIWAKTPALSVNYGIDCEVHSHEGRAITLEYPNFYLVNLYVPNSQNELARIDYRCLLYTSGPAGRRWLFS